MPKSTPNFSAWDNQIFSAKDALKRHPPRVYAVKPIFALPSLSIVYGHPGSHKTNILIDMAVCVAMGEKWLVGKNAALNAGYEVSPSPIFWVDKDSGEVELRERFGALLRAHNGNDQTPINYVSELDPPFDTSDDDSIKAMIAQTLKRKAKLLVIDNLGTISGANDENSSSMGGVMTKLRHLANKTGAAVIVIHHEPKQGQTRRTPRGHSSIEAAVDLALSVERDQHKVTLKATKTRGAQFDDFAAVWWFEEYPNTKSLKKARFYGIDLNLTPKRQRAQDLIMDHLTKHGPTIQTNLVNALHGAGLTKTVVRGELDWLVSKALIKEQRNQARGAILYSL